MDKTTDDMGPIRLTLVPLASDIPASIRVRMALKQLLRQFKLRCVKIEEPETDTKEDPHHV